jgi:hypothetical protein
VFLFATMGFKSKLDYDNETLPVLETKEPRGFNPSI